MKITECMPKMRDDEYVMYMRRMDCMSKEKG